MEKETYKVLDYIDDKGEEQTLTFECNTPHILISGDNLDDILFLEKKMLKNLSDSNGKEINLVVVDDSHVLSEDFFTDLDFNFVSHITEEDAIRRFSGNPKRSFLERYLFIYRNDKMTFTALNESGKEHMKMLLFFFPSISENEDLIKTLGECSGGIDVGVHAIVGTKFSLEKPHLIEGCDTRFSFPAKDVVKDLKFFRKRTYELPESGELWLKSGKTGDVLPIKLK